jgi:hypothetical protein
MQDRWAAAGDRDAAADERAAFDHECEARAYEKTAEFWDSHGEPEKAAQERALARVHRDAADLIRSRGPARLSAQGDVGTPGDS